jgi:phage terminase large subunit-like protein
MLSLTTSRRVDIRQFCRLLRHTEAPFTGKPFVPVDWQDDYFDKLFNTRTPDGKRQYRKSFLFLPRKQGKTAMVAPIALYEGFFGQHGGQIIIAAGDREQARKLFDACKNFLDSCPGLAKRCKVFKNSIFFPATKTTMQVISREAKTKHGFNPSLVVVDELHVQPNRDLIDVLTSGMGARAEPLVIYISTAGMDRIGPCYDEFLRAQKVRDGLIDDPTYLPCLYYAEQDDDPFSEETWKKAQPNYLVTVNKAFMENEVRLAKETVADEIKFRTLYLNQWVSNGSNRFFRTGQWEACDTPLLPTEGRLCYCGLDLSSTSDTTAFAAVWPHVDEDGVTTYDVHCRLFIPEEAADRDEAPYRQWAKDGFVTLTEGNTTCFDTVRNYVLSFCEKNSVRSVAIDRWNATHLTTQLIAEGIDVKPYGQGYASMSAPTKLLQTAVLSKRIRHGGNPPLAHQVSNMQVKQDDAGNIKPTKQHSHSTARIDGAVAMIMCFGLCGGEAPPLTDEPQLLVF